MTHLPRVDVAELAIRMIEANYGLKRPMPDATEALAAMDAEVCIAWLRSAQAAADYFIEVLQAKARLQ